MSVQRPFNFKKWIEENRHLLKPPVGKQSVYKACPIYTYDAADDHTPLDSAGTRFIKKKIPTEKNKN